MNTRPYGPTQSRSLNGILNLLTHWHINVDAGGGEGTASAFSSAAAAVAATPADADVAVEMAMSDDTTVTACDTNPINDGNWM